jgi:thioredoxin reductase (NADPH)
MGFDTTVMVRSIFLRGFDQDMAEMIAQHMEWYHTKFIRGATPVSLEKPDP